MARPCGARAWDFATIPQFVHAVPTTDRSSRGVGLGRLDSARRVHGRAGPHRCVGFRPQVELKGRVTDARGLARNDIISCGRIESPGKGGPQAVAPATPTPDASLTAPAAWSEDPPGATSCGIGTGPAGPRTSPMTGRRPRTLSDEGQRQRASWRRSPGMPRPIRPHLGRIVALWCVSHHHSPRSTRGRALARAARVIPALPRRLHEAIRTARPVLAASFLLRRRHRQLHLLGDLLARIGLGRWSAATARSATGASPCASARSPSAWAG